MKYLLFPSICIAIIKVYRNVSGLKLMLCMNFHVSPPYVTDSTDGPRNESSNQ